ncbi:hypothetical protein [Trinickia fusca]|uniref:Uncharacterized protein n=1 Tax=Trinickia fusca TaxID=2419777 RepID=A0A494XBR7_9BURK|nr:hypothetical protein [Trinickia fusca]RKP45579.1 hypothetical protein D7S89_19765 [Trinickia fusca]
MHTQATSKAAHVVACIGCGTALPPECTTCPRCGRPVLLRTAARAGPPPRTAGDDERAQAQTRASSALPRHFTQADPNGARRWGLSRGTAFMLFGFVLAFGTYIAIAEHENAQVKWRAVGGSVAKRAPSDTTNTAVAPPNPATSDALVALLAQQIASVRDEDAADAERLRNLPSQRGRQRHDHGRSSGETTVAAASAPSVEKQSIAVPPVQPLADMAVPVKPAPQAQKQAPASAPPLTQATPPAMPKLPIPSAPAQPPAQSIVQSPKPSQQHVAEVTVPTKPAPQAQAQATPPAIPKPSIPSAPAQPPAQSVVQSPAPSQQHLTEVTRSTKPAPQAQAPASTPPLARATPPAMPKPSIPPAPAQPPAQSMVQSPAPSQQHLANLTAPTTPPPRAQAPASTPPLVQTTPPAAPKPWLLPAPAQSMVQSPTPPPQHSTDLAIPTKPAPQAQMPASPAATRLAQAAPHAPHRRTTTPGRPHPPARAVAQAPKSPAAATPASKRQAPILAEQLAEGPAAGCSGNEPIDCTTTRDAPVVTLDTPFDSHSEEHADAPAGTRTEAETAADTRANTSATVSSGVVLRPEQAPNVEAAPPSSSTAQTAHAHTPERTASASHRHPNATRHVRAHTTNTNTSPSAWPSWPQWLADLPHDTRREPPRQERDPIYHGR